MIIGFYSPHLCIRGTTVAMFDYAYYNQKILGNKSVVFYNRNHHHNDAQSIHRFRNNFHTIDIADYHELDHKLVQEKCDAVYMIKGGYNDGKISRVCKTLVHCIATPGTEHKHGDVWAYGSEWLSLACSGGTMPYVPYMINLPDHQEDMRAELGIPKDAIVFGRTGGLDTWNLGFANDVVHDVVNETQNIYFIFQNTPKFYDHPKIKHIATSSDLNYKVKFINSCSGMIHARFEGESFGLACGEFSIRNKRIITYRDSPERNHIHVLGEKALYYINYEELKNTILHFKYEPEKDWNCYKKFNPHDVMQIFKKVFLEAK